MPKLVSFNVTSRRRPYPPVEAPAPGPIAVSRQARPATSPVNGRIDAPAPGPEADWTVDPPADSPAILDNAPVMTPVVSPPVYPDSEISLPPEGFSDAPVPAPSDGAVPAPVGLDLLVRKKRSSGDLEGVMELPEKSEALDGIRKCDVGIGLKGYDDHVHNMQCYAS